MGKRMNNDDGEAGGILNRLPLELKIQILLFLPVKTLLVLRAVCRWFLSVIDGSDFVSSHLRHNLSLPILLCVQRAQPEPRPEPDSWCKLQSSVDGLVLLVPDQFPNMSHSALLWNPSLKKKRYVIPMMPWGLKQFALGYKYSVDDERKDYRVLATSSDQAIVYSVESGTWSDVTLRSGYRHKDLPRVHCSRSVCLCDGNVAWGESSKSWKLVWFDFGSETFRYSDEMTCPARIGIFEMVVSTNTAVVGVGMWKVDGEGVASAWALRTDTMSWVPRYEVPEQVVPFGEGVEIMKVEELDGGLLACYYRTQVEARASLEAVWYDIHTCTIERRRGIPEPCYPQGPIWFGLFVESLITFEPDIIDNNSVWLLFL